MTWPSVSVGNLLRPVPSTSRIKKSCYLSQGETPVVDQSRTPIAGYTNDRDAVYSDPLPVVVFGDHTRILKYVDFPFARGADGTQVLRVDPDTVDPRFFYYALHTVDLSSYGYARHFKYLKSESISIPPLSAQRRISAVLASYDDLIDNNIRRMALAEEFIHLVFREWFVNLRFPGHERVAIVDGLPEGWQREQVVSLLAKLPAKTKIPKKEYQDSGAIPTIDQGREFVGGFTDDLTAMYQDALLPLVVFGDHTRILKFIDFPFARGADGTQVLSSNRESVSTLFLYFALSAIDLSGFGYARHFKYLKSEAVVVPTRLHVQLFDHVAGPAMRQVSLLRMQNQRLRKARDLLLPRLMDGRIPV